MPSGRGQEKIYIDKRGILYSERGEGKRLYNERRVGKSQISERKEGQKKMQ